MKFQVKEYLADEEDWDEIKFIPNTIPILCIKLYSTTTPVVTTPATLHYYGGRDSFLTFFKIYIF